MRIDKYLSEVIPDSSRSYIQKLIGDNRILVNDQPVKANYKLRENDSIQVTFPNRKLLILLQRIFLWIFYMKMTMF